jgi:hypothetical protein
MLNDEAVPVNPVPAPVKLVADSTPVDGTNVNLVEVVFSATLPVLADAKVRYNAVAVAVSSVIPTAVAEPALPVIVV